MKSRESFHVFSSLTGLSEEIISMPELTDFYIWLDNKLSFIKTPFEANDTNPNLIWEYKGETYHLPKDINYSSIGQYEDMKAIIGGLIDGKDPVELAEKYPVIVATYLQPLIQGEYDHRKAEELSKELMEYPCEDISNTANFFLSKFFLLSNVTPRCFHKRGLTQRLKRLASQSFIRLSGFMPRFLRSQTVTLRK